MRKNVMILGDGGHGKDTAAELYCASNPGASFASSSLFCAELFIFDILRANHGYATTRECFDDRHSHREVWHQLIKIYNCDNPTRLAREIYAEHDLYVGMRSKYELHGCFVEGLIDLVIWVDAFPRVPRESRGSMDIDFEWVRGNRARNCPLILMNNRDEGRQMVMSGGY